MNIGLPLLFLLKKLTGKRDLELVGNEQPRRNGAEKSQPAESARKSALNDSSNSSPSKLKSEVESKLDMNKKIPKETQGNYKSDVSVAAAIPLPSIDEEGI